MNLSVSFCQSLRGSHHSTRADTVTEEDSDEDKMRERDKIDYSTTI